ncbi:MAG: calcium/sodium antiporter [Actinomycetota bacterium]|nr:calcium/sodium antiporter [Actinomycetota bacterium]
MPDALLILLGLVALVGGAELIVRGGSKVAAGLGIAPIIIGVTVVSIGTSTPELAVGIEAAVQGNGSLAVGNIAGTNVVNLLLILGLSAALRPLEMHTQTLRLDLPVMVGAAAIVTVLAWGGAITRGEGILLVALAVLYTLVIVRIARRERPFVKQEYDREYATPAGAPETPSRFAWHGTLLLVGIVIVVVGADLLVDGASGLARAQGVSEAVIGLTIVALGTSAPELVTTVVSTVRGERDIAVGNLLGSSVFNLLLILGITAAVPATGIAVEQDLMRVDLPVMLGVALLCVPVFYSGRRVSRAEGIGFMALYGVYLTYLLIARV